MRAHIKGLHVKACDKAVSQRHYYIDDGENNTNSRATFASPIDGTHGVNKLSSYG